MIALAASVLAGCASTSSETNSGVWPAPPGSGSSTVGKVVPKTSTTPGVIGAPAPGASTGPLPGQPSPVPVEPVQPNLPNYPKSAADISGPAVVALLEQAQKDRAAGRYEQAGASLDRAAGIEPRNAFVWAALAKLYVDQNKYDEAQSMALKSNSLARGNVYVELENWKTIAAARDGAGDAVGSLQARTKVEDIERKLSGGG